MSLLCFWVMTQLFFVVYSEFLAARIFYVQINATGKMLKIIWSEGLKAFASSSLFFRYMKKGLGRHCALRDAIRNHS